MGGGGGDFVCVMKFLAETEGALRRSRGATSFARNRERDRRAASGDARGSAGAEEGAFLSLGAVCLAPSRYSSALFSTGAGSDVSQASRLRGCASHSPARGCGCYPGLNYLTVRLFFSPRYVGRVVSACGARDRPGLRTSLHGRRGQRRCVVTQADFRRTAQEQAASSRLFAGSARASAGALLLSEGEGFLYAARRERASWGFRRSAGCCLVR